MLLSATILNYPAAALINWGTDEAEDVYVQHLAKVGTILEYLEVLLEKANPDDLVLIVDGFDVHFQLPPEVIISRYFEENQRANDLIESQVGREIANRHDFKQTVIFGPDRYCWPMQAEHPACWAVPQPPGPRMSYGPREDSRPRFLNSGTIMGPVEDVRDIFRETLKLIHGNQTSGSDQYYFAAVFGNQEYVRGRLQPDEHFSGRKEKHVDLPSLKSGARTEYHIGLDYNWALFQTVAFFEDYLTWMTFDGFQKSTFPSLFTRKQQILTSDWYTERVIPNDIIRARPPFHAGIPMESQIASTPPGAKDSIKPPFPVHLGWNDLSLGANVITGQIFPVLHFTSRKLLRAEWWTRLWFFPYAEELLKASVKLPRAPFSTKAIGGKIWWPGKVLGQDDLINLGIKGGSFTGNGTFLAWDGICGVHEDELYRGIESPIDL